MIPPCETCQNGHTKSQRCYHPGWDKCKGKFYKEKIMQEEKVITCTISTSSGSITATDPKTLMDILFGSEGNINSRETIKDLFGHLEPHERETYTLTFEKRFTQKELDEMPESDGDIH